MPPLRMRRHRRRERQTRPRQQIAVEQKARVGSRERRRLAQPQPQAERRVADRAGDVETIAGRAPVRARHRARLRPRPSAVIDSVSGPGVLTVSPPSKRAAIGGRVVAEARGEGREPVRRPVRAAAPATSKKPSGSRALGGEIGEIDPQRLARDRVGRIVGEEMHAGDQRVGGQHEIEPGGGVSSADVVLQARARPARRAARSSGR